MQVLIVLLFLATFQRISESETLTRVPAEAQAQRGTWTDGVIQKLWDERKRMGHTPLNVVTLEGHPGVQFLLKDESASLTKSLKHRSAWSLMLWALVNAKILLPNQTVYEASEGNTAVSEAYMCQLAGLRFVAVVPNTINKQVEANIRKYGGQVVKTEPEKYITAAETIANKTNGCYMNQFGYSGFAKEHHESGNFHLESLNIFHEIYQQMNTNPKGGPKYPHFIVQSPGTGGTIVSIGKYIKKYLVPTKVVAVDSEFSVIYDWLVHGKFEDEDGHSLFKPPGIPGAGSNDQMIFGKTTSLIRPVIDRAIKVPDIATAAAVMILKALKINGGPSTALNFIASLHLAVKERFRPPKNDPLKIATIIGDAADNYESTFLNRTWIAQNFREHGGLKVYDCWLGELEDSVKLGSDPLLFGPYACQHDQRISLDLNLGCNKSSNVVHHSCNRYVQENYALLTVAIKRWMGIAEAKQIICAQKLDKSRCAENTQLYYKIVAQCAVQQLKLKPCVGDAEDNDDGGAFLRAARTVPEVGEKFLNAGGGKKWRKALLARSWGRIFQN